MKHFPPSLYLRLQDDNDAAADATDEAWETAVGDYAHRLNAIRADLLPAMLKLLDSYYLHDAKVSRLARAGNDFLIEVRPIYPPEDLILLRYSLVSEPSLDTESLRGHMVSSVVLWMYDEVDYDPASRLFTHDILFSNGWELGLRFRDVELILAHDLLPAPETRKVPDIAARTA